MIERLSPPGSPPPKGHYSPAVRAGDFIFVSGQGPYDSQGQFSPGDIQHETTVTLKNVQHILKGCGSGLEDVVKTSVFLADISEFAAFDKAYGDAFGATKPARTTVSAKFSNPKMKVEIDCVAYKPKS